MAHCFIDVSIPNTSPFPELSGRMCAIYEEATIVLLSQSISLLILQNVYLAGECDKAD